MTEPANPARVAVKPERAPAPPRPIVARVYEQGPTAKHALIPEARDGNGQAGMVMLTNCPSCIQGLGRSRKLGVEARHITVAMAERLSGEHWQQRFLAQAATAQTFTF